MTRLIFLVLLIVCFSCRTNNKPVSDIQKEKIKAEVKEVVKIIFKSIEEVNPDIIISSYLDSPDFIFTYNGNSFGYKQFSDMGKSVFNTLKNQKITVIDEKYAVLDNFTVLVTVNNKCLMNYKDGHSVLEDPWISQFIFKKTDNNWKVLSEAEYGVEKKVLGEISKKLNQNELLNKFIGSWEAPVGNETTQFIIIKSLQGGIGLSVYAKFVTKGKMLFEGTGFWGYDDAINKIDISVLSSTGDVVHDQGAFTSPDKMEFVNINNAKAYKGISKSIFEFISPDEIKRTDFFDKSAVSATWKRIK